MRIIAGLFRSRKLSAPGGRSIRPTGDRARESLFALLGDLGGISFLDLFAGTGAVGLEALSRGAAAVTFAEKEPAALACLSRNIEVLGAAGPSRVIRGDWLAACRRLEREEGRFHVVFADPPYESGLAEICLRATCTSAILRPAGLLIIEHRRKVFLPNPPAPLSLARRHGVGEAVFSMYRKEVPT